MKNYLKKLPEIYIAFVFIQSLFFKFSGAPESIYIFQTIEDWLSLSFFEPGMRYVIGTTELVASLMLFVPGLRHIGALLSIGVISGAIFFHLFSPLGIVVKDDAGTLFIMAIGVWIASAYILYMNRGVFFRKALN